MKGFFSIFESLLNELFPVLCFKCGKRGAYICTDCISRMPKTTLDEPDFISVFAYKDETIRHLLSVLKYKSGRDIARICGALIYEELCALLSERALFGEFEKPIIIPVPLSESRARERGFNQAELIAQEVAGAEKTFELCTGVLVKRKETRPQATIKNRAERLKNIVGCFHIVHPEKIHGRNIILIDDIYTTGGTMKEARKVLEQAGARNILCATVAH